MKDYVAAHGMDDEQEGMYRDRLRSPSTARPMQLPPETCLRRTYASRNLKGDIRDKQKEEKKKETYFVGISTHQNLGPLKTSQLAQEDREQETRSLVKKWEEWTEAALQRTLQTAKEGLVRELNARINDAGATMGTPQNEAEPELQDLGPEIEIKIGDRTLDQDDIIELLGLGGLADSTLPPSCPGFTYNLRGGCSTARIAPPSFSNLSPTAMTCRDDSPARVPPQEREYTMRMSSYTESRLDILLLPEHPILGNLTRDARGKSIYDLLSDAISQYTQYRQYNMFSSICLSSPATIVYAPMQTRYGPARPCVQMMAMQAESHPDGMDRVGIHYGLAVSFFFGSDARPPGSFFPTPIVGELFPSPSVGPRFSDDLAGAVGMTQRPQNAESEGNTSNDVSDPHSPTTVPAIPAHSPTLAAVLIVPAITPAASPTVAALNLTQLAAVADQASLYYNYNTFQ
ncbi:hypothetical protein BKA93DRAFT_751005 [Sparassis latifolia]